jgi:hypothetical protein
MKPTDTIQLDLTFEDPFKWTSPPVNRDTFLSKLEIFSDKEGQALLDAVFDHHYEKLHMFTPEEFFFIHTVLLMKKAVGVKVDFMEMMATIQGMVAYKNLSADDKQEILDEAKQAYYSQIGTPVKTFTTTLDQMNSKNFKVFSPASAILNLFLSFSSGIDEQGSLKFSCSGIREFVRSYSLDYETLLNLLVLPITLNNIQNTLSGETIHMPKYFP